MAYGAPSIPQNNKARMLLHSFLPDADASEKLNGPKKQNRCGECAGCTGDDCGACANCADKPKFGGQGRTSMSYRPASQSLLRVTHLLCSSFIGGTGIKKQACFSRRCVLVKQGGFEMATPSQARKRWKLNSGSSAYPIPDGGNELDDVSPPPPRAHPPPARDVCPPPMHNVMRNVMREHGPALAVPR